MLVPLVRSWIRRARSSPRALPAAQERGELLALPHVVQDQQRARALVQQPAQMGAGESGVVELLGVPGDEAGGLGHLRRDRRPAAYVPADGDGVHPAPEPPPYLGVGAHTPASVVFPKPPAPDSEVVIPTAPPLPHTAATTSSPCPRSTTQSATGCGSGGGGSPAAAAGFSCRTATAAATRTASRAVPATDSQELRRNRSRTPGQRASDVAALAASAPSTASATPAPASSTMHVTRPRTRTPVYPVVRPAPTLSATTGARRRVARSGRDGVRVLGVLAVVRAR